MSILRVTAFIQGGDLPSDRFRIIQNVPHLAKQGIRVTAYSPFLRLYARLPGRLGKIRERYLLPVTLVKTVLTIGGRISGTLASYRADLAWIGRSFVPGLENLVQFVKGPRVLDVDDAIWMTTPFGRGAAARFARKMDAVIANNSFVADWYSQYCKNVYVVPDGIDTERFKPADKALKSDTDNFVVGWTGTSVNFGELYNIEPALVRFLKDHPKARLRVISNEPPKFDDIPPAQLEFKQWTAEAEGTNLSDLDVGIMPMRETEWTKGKNSNKMLCYMASGLPVVVSPVGTNKEILALDDIGLAPDSLDSWYDCLTEILDNGTLRTDMGERGREIVERQFSIEIVSAQLAKIFREIAD